METEVSKIAVAPMASVPFGRRSWEDLPQKPLKRPRQRVKIALGLAWEPKLLLLDEPTQNLDIGRRVDLIDLLHYLHDEGITIVASIHDLHLIHHNFSCVHLMGPDHSLVSGTPKDILTPTRIASAFNCALGRHLLLMEAPSIHSSQGLQ